jgi:uncharacterized ion transporter superfamily protein YfcC
MYRFGFFLENLAAALFALLMIIGVIKAFSGDDRDFNQYSSGDQQLIGIIMMVCILFGVLGWALKGAAQASPPDKKD